MHGIPSTTFYVLYLAIPMFRYLPTPPSMLSYLFNWTILKSRACYGWDLLVFDGKPIEIAINVMK